MKKRKHRASGEGTECLSGYHSVREALVAQRRRFFEVWCVEEKRDRENKKVSEQSVDEIRHLCGGLGVPFKWVSRRLFDGKLVGASGTEKSQWLAARVGVYPYQGAAEVFEVSANSVGAKKVVLACDQVQDPQNLGALLRSFLALGGKWVLLPKKHNAKITPAVCRAAAGATEHLQIGLVANLGMALNRLKEKGFWIIASASQGTAGLEQIPDAPLVLVLGNEEDGVRQGVLQKSDLVVSIPTRQEFPSLNVSASAAILFYAAFQRPN